MVEILRYPLSRYRDMWELQRALHAAVLVGERNPVIISTQHEAVYTLGKHGKEENMLALPQGVECIRTDRGGDITYHGPGIRILYPILPLARYGLGVKAYVHLLEQAVIDTLADYGICGERVEGATGVWIGAGTAEERKICAIGVKVSHGVTMHGLALCVDTALAPFARIHPCGFVTKGVTTMEREAACDAPPLTEVEDRLLSHLLSLLGEK